MDTHQPHAARMDHEIEHGRFLAREGAEGVWNWSSPAGQKRADRRASYLAEIGEITSKDRAIEIGCGTGLFTRKVAETGARITAIDVSEDLLKIARETGSQEGITYVQGDAENLAFKEGEFDVAFGSSILHHLDFEKSLSELFRVLKPGGRLAFAEPNMLNPQILIQKNVPFLKKSLGDSPDETAVVRWKLKAQMERIGFTNVRIIPYDFLHPMTPAPLIGIVEKIGLAIEKIPGLREIAGSVIIYGQKP